MSLALNVFKLQMQKKKKKKKITATKKQIENYSNVTDFYLFRFEWTH